MTSTRDTVAEFISDIEPFFYGRRLTYVDVGAFHGQVFKDFKASRLRIREAHLIEPNPVSIEVLREQLRDLPKGNNTHIHHLALGEKNGTLRLLHGKGMTKAAPAEITLNIVNAASYFETPCSTLDALSVTFTEQHISVLKIDVEGYELNVLSGANNMLNNELIDVIYIEAGIKPDSKQQCYWRDIDDVLMRHGYSLFRIYEQKFEWITDSPLLRRVNMAYMSSAFSKNNPYRITQELFTAKRENETAKVMVESLQKEQKELARKLEESVAQNLEQRHKLDVLTDKNNAFEKNNSEYQRTANELSVKLKLAETSISDQQRITNELNIKLELAETSNIEYQRIANELGTKLELAETSISNQQRFTNELNIKLELAEASYSKQKRIAEDLNDALRSLTTKLDEVTQRHSQESHLNETMNRDLFRLYDTAISVQRRAVLRAQSAAQNERRSKLTLAYRLGATLITNGRNPLRWPLLPLALLRMSREYRRDLAHNLLTKSQPSTLPIAFHKDQVTVVPKSEWQTISLPATETPMSVRLTTLSVSRKGSLLIELAATSTPLHNKLQELASRQGKIERDPATSIDGIELKTVPGQSIDLFTILGPSTELRLRKVSGLPSILKFDAQPSEDPIVGVPPAPTSSLETLPSTSKPEATIPVKQHVLIAPKPMKSAIIWQAAQMMSDGHPEQAIAFATKHARPFIQPAVSLLKASIAVGNDAIWLNHVNSYLKQFDVLPLRLTTGSEPLFHRLTTADAPKVDQGPLVTVIMPTFNSETTLELAVRSVLRQSWQPLELIIVDDCSEDGTNSIAQSIARTDSRVRVLRNRVNVGPYVSKNLALMIARGIYITGHDSDDWAHPQRIERQVQAMLNSEGKLRASMARMLRLNENGLFGHFAKEGKTSDDGVLRDASISCMFETTLLRKELGFWDSVRFGADSELISRVQHVLGDRFARLRQFSMLCLDHEFSLTNDPVNGVSRVYGISPTRRYYRDQWSSWHETMDPAQAFLPFPHEKRIFAAPEVAEVPGENLKTVIADLHSQSGN